MHSPEKKTVTCEVNCQIHSQFAVFSSPGVKRLSHYGPSGFWCRITIVSLSASKAMHSTLWEATLPRLRSSMAEVAPVASTAKARVQADLGAGKLPLQPDSDCYIYIYVYIYI